MNERKNDRWFLLLFMAFAILFAGCDDSTPPELKYLGPPEIVSMASHDEVWRLDAWQLGGDGYPAYAAFGWRVRFYWLATGVLYDEPGVHITFTTGDTYVPCGPELGSYITGTGLPAEGETEGPVTIVTGDSGIARFYLGLNNWPGEILIENRITAVWHVQGMDDDTDITTDVWFVQDSAPFFAYNGGYEYSTQGLLSPAPQGMSLPNSPPPPPDIVPMDLGPTESLKKVPVADIPKASIECAFSVDYPPSNDPNASDVDILIHSRWMKVRAESGVWEISPAPFIGLLPCDSNNIDSVAEAAWPYTVCFHAPAESEGMVAIDAKLEVVNANSVCVDSIGIVVHEAGPCLNPVCDGWLWRSDYILPLAGYPATGPLLTWAGDVLVCWLPLGHTMKLRPPGKAAILSALSPKWLVGGSILDRNGDGVVNFKDYAAFLR